MGVSGGDVGPVLDQGGNYIVAAPRRLGRDAGPARGGEYSDAQ
jgi:hypothetical protein